MNQVKTLFFATLRDRAGVKSIELEIPLQICVAEFKILLIEKFPVLTDVLNHTLISINHEYVFDDTMIPPNAEIAIFPPVSGG